MSELVANRSIPWASLFCQRMSKLLLINIMQHGSLIGVKNICLILIAAFRSGNHRLLLHQLCSTALGILKFCGQKCRGACSPLQISLQILLFMWVVFAEGSCLKGNKNSDRLCAKRRKMAKIFTFLTTLFSPSSPAIGTDLSFWGCFLNFSDYTEETKVL